MLMYIYLTDKIAKVGETLYTLEKAIEIASSGSENTITITENLQTDKQYTIPGNANITLDLNGKVINSKFDGNAIVVNGKLTIKDSSTTNSGEIVGDIALANTDNLTVQSGKFTGNFVAANTSVKLENSLNILGGLFTQNVGPLLKDVEQNVIKNDDGYYEFFTVSTRADFVKLLNSWIVFEKNSEDIDIQRVNFEDDVILSKLTDYTPITHSDLNHTNKSYQLIVDGNGKYISGISEENNAAATFDFDVSYYVKNGGRYWTVIQDLTVQDSKFKGNLYSAAINCNYGGERNVYYNVTVEE